MSEARVVEEEEVVEVARSQLTMQGLGADLGAAVLAFSDLEAAVRGA